MRKPVKKSGSFLFRIAFAVILIAGLAGSVGSRAVAQDNKAAPAPLQSSSVSSAAAASQAIASPTTANAPKAPGQAGASDLNPNDMQPLVFTYWEHAAINDARQSRGLVRPPSEEELARSLHTPPGEKIRPSPEQREIVLNGIVFAGGDDWTIWLNGKRVTPKALPKEALDLKVYKNYVEMKWFDDYTNQIFPLRLHPHERFNLDTRIFLPG